MPRAKAKSGSSYAGVLAKPMKLAKAERMLTGLAPAAGSIEWQADHQDELAPQFAERLEALFNHYGIRRPIDAPQTEDQALGVAWAWGALALALAEAHVPGFRFRETSMPGRKRGGRKIDPKLVYTLVFEKLRRPRKLTAQRLTAPRRLSVLEVCRLLSKSHSEFKGIKPETIRRAFNEARMEKRKRLLLSAAMLALVNRGTPWVVLPVEWKGAVLGMVGSRAKKKPGR